MHPLRARRDHPAIGADERAEPAFHLEAKVADDPGDLHEVRPVVDVGGGPPPVPRQVRGLGVEDEDLIAVAGSRLNRQQRPSRRHTEPPTRANRRRPR